MTHGPSRCHDSSTGKEVPSQTPQWRCLQWELSRVPFHEPTSKANGCWLFGRAMLLPAETMDHTLRYPASTFG